MSGEDTGFLELEVEIEEGVDDIGDWRLQRWTGEANIVEDFADVQ